MSKNVEITVEANPDADDCLAAAAASYVSAHPDLAGWDLAPRWADEERDVVILAVPVALMAHGGKRTGSGRPRTAPGGAGAPLAIRLTPEDRATLDALCVRHRETQAGVVRLALAALARADRDEECENPSYTCTGSVRGNCGRAHRSIDTALACIRRDQHGCKSQGGYSDRHVCRVDGEPLTASELGQ